ncbi:MAG: type II toxin-antitoxin system RelE/ParE family toxin [Reyranella sp.]|uniref:type II toxin-antitoxin system RelE/ParE family toxin n=1 Tax=Reyranella sp. TaxID=1929291 RepID=UPI001207CD24|nr:type II toxin-antitoxin system RelE/ParE family toxin [Reyranella sp.]TAJ97224.1 MAG: type II toxin-antitoxin system RelE/ParE family toxin [Reyranella sp.]TBR28486.1 MAG: type II toxin-antitoxin system RelE/ParE family toxin [Reyranella sp.]
MKRYTVILTEQALLDLDDIARYIALHDLPEKAEHVANRIEEALASLASLPDRGQYPRELLTLGNRSFREIHFKPYRIVYRVYEREVVVFLIADGRRDMRALLARRLLGA